MLRWRQEELEEAGQAVPGRTGPIARELHDVIAHSLTVMTVQTGVARRVLSHPGPAGDVLGSIESTGRVAQGELRLILGLLRDDEQEKAALAPTLT